MRLLIGKCNNTDCSECNDGRCNLSTNIVHEFQYDHDTGLLSCQFYADEKAERKPVVENIGGLLDQKGCVNPKCQVLIFSEATICWNCKSKQA